MPTDVQIGHPDYANDRWGFNTMTPSSIIHICELSDSTPALTLQRVSADANEEVYFNMINSDGNTLKISHTGTETFTITNANADVYVFGAAGELTVPGVLKLKGAAGADAAGALILGVGTSNDPALNAVADKHFIEIRCKHNATSGDNRGIYLRTEFANTGGGDGIRNNVVLTGQAAQVNAFHTGLDIQTGGEISGSANASRSTIMFGNEATPSGGSITAIQPELYASGTATDISATDYVSYIRSDLIGNATGMANIDDNAFWANFAGGITAGSGNMIDTDITTHTAYAGIRIVIGGVTKYIAVVND